MHKKQFNSISLIVGLFNIVLSFPTFAESFGIFDNAIYENRVSMFSNTEYNSNPGLIQRGYSGLFQETIIPSYRISHLNDIQELFVDLKLRVVRSTDKQVVIDREDPLAQVGYQFQYNQGSVSINANYSESSARNTELSESGIVFLDLTNINRNASIAWRHEINDLFTLNSTARINKTEFAGGNSNLIGSRDNQVNSTLSYLVNEKLTSILQIGFSEQSPDNLDSTRNLNLTTGLDFNYTENTRLGFRYGRNKISGVLSENTWSASINAGYITDKSNFSGEMSRSITPSNLGALNESDRLILNWGYELSDRSNISLNYNFNKNRLVNTIESTQYSAGYSYSVSERLRLGLNASLRELDTGIGSKADAKVIGFTLSYDHPVF